LISPRISLALDVTGTHTNITLNNLTEDKALFSWWSVKSQMEKALDRSKTEAAANTSAYENIKSAMERGNEIDEQEKGKAKVALDIEKNKHFWYAIGGAGAGILIGVGLIALVNSATKLMPIPFDTGAMSIHRSFGLRF